MKVSHIQKSGTSWAQGAPHPGCLGHTIRDRSVLLHSHHLFISFSEASGSCRPQHPAPYTLQPADQLRFVLSACFSLGRRHLPGKRTAFEELWQTRGPGPPQSREDRQRHRHLTSQEAEHHPTCSLLLGVPCTRMTRLALASCPGASVAARTHLARLQRPLLNAAHGPSCHFSGRCAGLCCARSRSPVRGQQGEVPSTPPSRLSVCFQISGPVLIAAPVFLLLTKLLSSPASWVTALCPMVLSKQHLPVCGSPTRAFFFFLI